MQVLKRVLVLGIIFSLSFAAVGAAQIPQEGSSETQMTGLASDVPEPSPEVDFSQAPPVVSQEAAESVPEEAAMLAQEVVVQPAAEKPAEWAWGEVVSVDKGSRQLVIKHLDYDTYEEVRTTLTIDDRTLLENVTDLGEIKPQDHVTVDYKVDRGFNIAGLIVVEKPKESMPLAEAKMEQVSAETLTPPEAALEPVAPETPADIQVAPQEEAVK